MIFYHCMERANPASSRSYCIYTGIPLRNLCTCSRRMALGYLGLRLKDSYLGQKAWLKISQRMPGKGSNSEPGNTLSEATPLT